MRPQDLQDSLGDAEGIAVIGLANRFPGSSDSKQYWRNLESGIDSIASLSDEELLASGVEPDQFEQSDYVRAASYIEDMELFDAAFFDVTPREAEVLDPQQRLLLECAWEALESSGYDPQQFKGRIGIYAGSRISDYFLYNILARPEVIGTVGRLQVLFGNDKDYLATFAAYKLGLTGPSIAVQTACSSALVSVHLACESLLHFESDMVIAGGVSVHLPYKSGYTYLEGGLLSPDGRCRSFDARAAGTVFGSGVGVVVLRRLEDALESGDHIHAVIRGSAVNNDGALKLSFSAPGEDGQAAVITEAMEVAGVESEDISYVEAHGSGTALGDPIEVAALTRAFRQGTENTGFCALGSVKSNFGHLEAAAGIAGLIKTVLALENRTIPPSLHFERPNPASTWRRVLSSSTPRQVPGKAMAGRVAPASTHSDSAAPTLMSWLRKHPNASLPGRRGAGRYYHSRRVRLTRSRRRRIGWCGSSKRRPSTTSLTSSTPTRRDAATSSTDDWCSARIVKMPCMPLRRAIRRAFSRIPARSANAL